MKAHAERECSKQKFPAANKMRQYELTAKAKSYSMVSYKKTV